MKKRKRDEGSKTGSSSATLQRDSTSGKKPAVVSGNWLQLQATLNKRRGGGNARRHPKSGSSATGEYKGDDRAKGGQSKVEDPVVSLLPTSSDCSLTKVLALDCEMVGVGPEGKKNALARVSIVNVWGNVVYDKYVRPPDYVTDFRTTVSGVRSRDLRTAQDFATTQKEVTEMLTNRILVGHALRNDLKVLLLSHPRKHIRDTQRYGPYRSATGGIQALKHLAFSQLKVHIQQKEHDSVEDARAALRLYLHSKDAWEQSLRQGRKAGR